jgi:calnexin
MDCGGSYIKLFGADNFSPATLCNETRYIVMFGPDRCGPSDKVHFIFRHKDSVTGVYEEKHLKDPPGVKTDSLTHLYTLVVRPDNTAEILIDGESVRQANLLTDFEPPVNPPKLINDPNDKKPSDWVDLAEIEDPDARKPDDWDETLPEFIPDPDRSEPPEGWLPDEPKYIVDPEAKKPDDWEDDIHGDWEPPTIPNPKCDNARGCGEFEPPLIKNPKYKGKWKRPKIANPAYKGPWKPRQIENPDYHEDLHPHNFEPIIGAGFELWMVSRNVGYGNVYIGNDEAAVHRWNRAHFLPKSKRQQEEEKKLQPTPDPDDTDAEGKRFSASLRQFGETFKDAWQGLYEENQVATIAVTAVLVLLPLLLWLLCRRKPQAPGTPAGNRKRPGTPAAEPSPKK